MVENNNIDLNNISANETIGENDLTLDASFYGQYSDILTDFSGDLSIDSSCFSIVGSSTNIVASSVDIHNYIDSIVVSDQDVEIVNTELLHNISVNETYIYNNTVSCGTSMSAAEFSRNIEWRKINKLKFFLMLIQEKIKNRIAKKSCDVFINNIIGESIDGIFRL